MAERFERHSRTFSLVTVVSRITGLARDAAFSRIFGAGAVMDAFFFAFIVPNLFRRLFGEGAVAAAFLRVYAQLDRDEPETARRLAALTLGLLLAGLGALTLVAEVVLWIISAQADHQHLPLRLTMIMLPYMPLVCVVAVLASMLQVHGRFGAPAAAPILLNACLIVAAVGLAPYFGPADRQRHVTVVAAAVVVAGLLQAAWMVRALRGVGLRARGLSAAREPFRAMLAQAGPMILGLGVLQLNTFVDGLIASYPVTVGSTILGAEYPLRHGALAAVSFAQRLYQFPLGVFGIAVATAIYPALARQAADEDAFADILRRGLRLVAFIGLPASAGLMLVGGPLARVIYEGGRFAAADAQRVTFVLLGYAAGVWAYSLIHVLTRAFYARGDARTPLRAALGVVGLNLALNCTLIWTPLREAGLAWSTTACAVIQCAALLAVLHRRRRGVVDAAVRRSVGRSVLVTAAMTAAVGGLVAALPQPATWPQALVFLALAVAAGLAVVGALSRALGMVELAWALGKEKRPFRESCG